MKTKWFRSGFVAVVLVALPFVAGCVGNRFYHNDHIPKPTDVVTAPDLDGASAERIQSGYKDALFSYLTEPFVIEFDDQGEYWDTPSWVGKGSVGSAGRRSQFEIARDAVRLAKKAGYDITLVEFAHGWKHNADPAEDTRTPSNLQSFRSFMEALNEVPEPTAGTTRPVAAALRTAADTLEARATFRPADLILLLNPAADSLYSRQFVEAVNDAELLRAIPRSVSAASPPWIVSISSSADWATGQVYGWSSYLGWPFRSYRSDSDRDQRRFFGTPAPHNPHFRNFTLDPVFEPATVGVPRDKKRLLADACAVLAAPGPAAAAELLQLNLDGEELNSWLGNRGQKPIPNAILTPREIYCLKPTDDPLEVTRLRAPYWSILTDGSPLDETNYEGTVPNNRELYWKMPVGAVKPPETTLTFNLTPAGVLSWQHRTVTHSLTLQRGGELHLIVVLRATDNGRLTVPAFDGQPVTELQV